MFFSCEEILRDEVTKTQLHNNNKNSRIQSLSEDEIIADSILTQVIGYITATIDTVTIVNFVDIHITGGKKYVIINCLTASTPYGHSIGIQYYDSTAIGLNTEKVSKEVQCVEVNGCENVCGSCDWSVGEFPTRLCKCDAGSTGSGDCGVESSQLSLLGYEVLGQIIRNNAVISNMNIYEY